MVQHSNPIKSGVSFTFKKEERLCSKKLFEMLFDKGISFLVYPLKVNVLETTFESKYPVKAAFAVSKRSFRESARRNTLKRRMREAYRLNKHTLYATVAHRRVAVAFVFIGKKTEPFSKIENAMKRALDTIPLKLDNKK